MNITMAYFFLVFPLDPKYTGSNNFDTSPYLGDRINWEWEKSFFSSFINTMLNLFGFI